MKKTLILSVLIVVGLFMTDLVYSSENGITPAKEVELKSIRKPKPTKSLVLPPDVRAYIYPDRIEIVFDEAVPNPVAVTITENGGEVIYSETIQVNSPMNWPVLIDFDENSFYELEIMTGEWGFYGGI